MNAVTHLEKVITGEVSAVTHLEKVIAGETSAVTYTEKVITGEATPITHLQKVIAGVESPVTHLEYVWAGSSPEPTEHEYTGAVPVTFNADGTPLIDWVIYGNTVQSGTPTPDSPVMPESTGERTGNLYNTTATDWTLGILDDNGQPTGSTSSHYTTNYTEVSPQTAYVLSGTISTAGSLRVYFYSSDKSWISRTAQKATGDFTTPQNCFYIRIQVTVTIDDTSDWMLNLGSTPLPYEPYGYKIPISSASTTTPVYLGEVETTRKIKKLVLTGQGRWNKSGAYQGSFYLGGVSPEPISLTEQAYCSHAEFTSISTYAKNKFCFNGSPINLNLWIGESSWTTDDFKAYLAQQYAAGTPVTVWYVLATEETGIIVNEPLRKIDTYTDTLSMEQAGVSIPTNNGSTTVDVETTLKPSEVYIKYKGV